MHRQMVHVYFTPLLIHVYLYISGRCESFQPRYKAIRIYQRISSRSRKLQTRYQVLRHPSGSKRLEMGYSSTVEISYHL